ncbi:MAG: peptidase rane alanine aminopeptidase [Candidatus Angelobacter sp.]|jgi:predicted negative regulator of RcsB-dependent stress response|nr:peptidase rane alanine aminopeptidase [Candidatus Angelobacter sp.]
MVSARLLQRASRLSIALLLVLAPLCLQAAEKARLRADDYLIDAELFPATHKLVAHAKVKVTAIDDISVAVFELHNGLRPTKITNAAGQTLSGERVTQDSTLRIPLPAGLPKGTSTILNFDYEGTLSSADESPVEGLKLAYVGEGISYLLYAGRWFPTLNYGVNRFTATMNITVPAAMRVVGSGRPAQKPAGAGKTTHTFVWEKPSFPGTIIAGVFNETTANVGGVTVRTFFLPTKKDFAPVYAETAEKEFEFYSSIYGPPLSTDLNIVELPDDTVPSAWAPEIAGLASRAISEKTNYRLLANAIAHQWWGVSASPATRDDFWLQDGFARYSEIRYVEHAAGRAGFEEASKDMAVGALAYDTIPLSSAGKLEMFSPEFQSLTSDKGAMILHMLRWEIGDAAFDKTMRAFATQSVGKAVRADDFAKVAEATSGGNLTPFFAQWLDGTGAPEFKNKYSVYRIAKGFRVVGEVSQDLDLFRMPMEVRVDTDGQPEMKRIEVVGTRSPYVIETFGKPRRIALDPNNWVLKNSDDLKVRVSILRGQQLIAQGDYGEALKQFNKSLEANHNSSLAHYRIAEVFFLQHNYQAAANAYREALNGDGEPKWTEVWSHIQLGKIFDITGQRERATNEYRQALQTNDNTQGALDEARRYLSAPFKKEKEKEANGA